jgi:hypothetical protein
MVDTDSTSSTQQITPTWHSNLREKLLSGPKSFSWYREDGENLVVWKGIVANQFLETDLEKLKAVVSMGYARGKLFEVAKTLPTSAQQG